MHQLKLKKRPGAAKTVSDKLHEQFASATISRRKSGDDSDDDDLSRPQVTEFDENDGEIERAVGAGLSDIRKSNVRLLESVDRKYHGKVASRKDVFDEEDSDDDDSEDGAGAFVRLSRFQESEEESDGSGNGSEEVDEDEDEADLPVGAFVKANRVQGSDESEESGSDQDSDESDEEDEDFSLGDFMGSSGTESQKLLQDENRQEAVQKGICVQNQLKMWERLLEMRIKMQSCLTTANSLPHEDKFSSFSQDDQFKEATSKVVQTVESTLANLLELQTNLIERFPETNDLAKSGAKRKLKDLKSKSAKHSRLANFEPLLAESFVSYKPYRNDVIQKWHDRTRASSSSKNAAHQSLSVVKKIDNALLAKDELVRKTQLFRGGYTLFEQPTAIPSRERHGDENGDGDAEPEPLYDGEIYDDSDFYHALLRELIEYKSNTTENPQEIGAKLAELQKLRSKMKKQVDTRASKGRKIRYVVHKKLVNFTAPEPSHEWTEDAKNELFSSLFGATGSEV